MAAARRLAGPGLLAVAAVLIVLIWRLGFFESLRSGESFSFETFKGVVVAMAAILTPLS